MFSQLQSWLSNTTMKMNVKEEGLTYSGISTRTLRVRGKGSGLYMGQLLVLAIYTPVMTHAHCLVSEVVYYDLTSSLDPYTYNCPAFILST